MMWFRRVTKDVDALEAEVTLTLRCQELPAQQRADIERRLDVIRLLADPRAEVGVCHVG